MSNAKQQGRTKEPGQQTPSQKGSRQTEGTSQKELPPQSPSQQSKAESNLFKFEVGCEHTPEFKTAYEMVYKSNIMYTDSNGLGQSYNSEITGGAAGSNHNNVVTSTVDQTYQAMAIANGMLNKNMTKVVSNLQKDIKGLIQKPQMAFFNGKRVQFNEVIE